MPEPVATPIPAHRPGSPPPTRRPQTGPGVEALFANEDSEESPSPSPAPAQDDDPVREAVRAAEPPSERPGQRTPAEAARDELAALLAETEAQARPAPPQAAARDPLIGSAPAPAAPPPPASPEPSALESLTGRPESESWDAIETLFNRKLEEPGEEGSGLQLDWERPEMFTEPTQEEILRRIGELAHGMDLVQQRIDELARPLAEITEPGTRMAAAFKRLELIERSFEEMRLQTERSSLKTTSGLSSVDSSLGELRAAMEEPMWEMSERLTSAEIRLTELQANERMVEQLNIALSKDPFDLVSTRDIDELTENITTKVKRLGGRVERLEAALDRGLSGLEEARRSALSAAKEMNKIVEKANRVIQARPAPAPRAVPKPAPKKAATKKAAGKKATAKKATARKPAKRAARKPGS
jgi:hypothetical protein